MKQENREEQTEAAYFLLDMVSESQSRPSYKPSPVVAQQA